MSSMKKHNCRQQRVIKKHYQSVFSPSAIFFLEEQLKCQKVSFWFKTSPGTPDILEQLNLICPFPCLPHQPPKHLFSRDQYGIRLYLNCHFLLLPFHKNEQYSFPPLHSDRAFTLPHFKIGNACLNFHETSSSISLHLFLKHPTK